MNKLPQYAITSATRPGMFSWFDTQHEAEAFLQDLARIAVASKFTNVRAWASQPRQLLTRAEALARK